MAYSSSWVKATGILQIIDASGTAHDLPDPAKIKYSVQDIDSASSGRGLDGNNLRDRVAVKEKLIISWPPLQASDVEQILALIADASFNCRFWSLKTGGFRTANMYAGDRSADAYNLMEGKATDIWTGLSIDFVEN